MMKYNSTIKSRQFILAENGKKIFIEPGEGKLSDDEALAVAKSPWGKRLIEAKSLVFEKTIEVKDEKVERGMTIPKGEKSSVGDDVNGDESDDGEDPDTEEPDDSTSEASEDEIPDFDETEGGEGQ